MHPGIYASNITLDPETIVATAPSLLLIEQVRTTRQDGFLAIAIQQFTAAAENFVSMSPFADDLLTSQRA
jgi:hypothetical protein